MRSLKQLKQRLVGPARGQLAGQDLKAMLRNGGILLAGEVLTRLYAYVSTTDLGSYGPLYTLVVAGVLDLVRRVIQDNTKPKSKTKTTK